MATESRGSSVRQGTEQGAAAGTMISPGWGTVIGAGIGAGAAMISSSMANKRRKQELAAEKEMREREMGMEARKMYMDTEAQGSNREAAALNNVIEGLRRSLRR